MGVKLKLKDKTPIFHHTISNIGRRKIIVDGEMRKGCLLGILRKGLSTYSSPIMLIPRKMSGIPCIITDFRHFNSRFVRLNHSFLLVRDAIWILGALDCGCFPYVKSCILFWCLINSVISCMYEWEIILWFFFIEENESHMQAYKSLYASPSNIKITSSSQINYSNIWSLWHLPLSKTWYGFKCFIGYLADLH